MAILVLMSLLVVTVNPVHAQNHPGKETSRSAKKQKPAKLDRKILGDELAFGRKAAEFGLWNEAIFRWEKVQKADPNNAQALNNLAVAYESVGNYDRAGELYQAALDLNEDSADIRKNLKRFKAFYKKHKRQLAREKKARGKTKPETGEGIEVNTDPPESGEGSGDRR
jgi:Flp pilus assembly protein TadD